MGAAERDVGEGGAMSTEKSMEECWAVQLAYHQQAGTDPPTTMSAELEADLRAIMGDEIVDRIKAEEAAQ